jgi:hypothetical protein
MRFIQETGFSTKTNMTPDLQQWVAANFDRFAASYPEGMELIGIFVTVFTSEKNAGDVRMLERLDSYGALDRMAAAGKDLNGDFGRLFHEFLSFMDPTSTAAWSATLLKDMVDATVFRYDVERAGKAGPTPAGA